MYGERLARWERAAEWPLTFTAVLFLLAYATQILARPQGAVEGVAEVVLWLTWAVFLIDYVVRLVVAEHRWRWISRHLLDLAIVVPPMLRPLRLMRFLTIIALIQRNAGSIFKNPRPTPAGRLIEAAGLKGTRVGQAMVSEMHANFIVNLGGATAADVIALMELIRVRVRAHAGVDLELEVRIIGEK